MPKPEPSNIHHIPAVYRTKASALRSCGNLSLRCTAILPRKIRYGRCRIFTLRARPSLRRLRSGAAHDRRCRNDFAVLAAARCAARPLRFHPVGSEASEASRLRDYARHRSGSTAQSEYVDNKPRVGWGAGRPKLTG